MKFHLHRAIKPLLLGAVALLVLGSCNKEDITPVPIQPSAASGQTIAALINSDASFGILKAAIARATPSGGRQSLATLLSDSTATYTVFAPTDAAFQVAFQMLGIPSAVGINAFSPGQLDTILRYHIVGGERILSDSIVKRKPNFQLPTLLELALPSSALPPGLRMSVFPSAVGSTLWVNNVPVTAAGIAASNGIVYKMATPLLPPTSFLWDRISADPDLTYLKAAIRRADEGVASASTLQAALQNPAASLTVFAPTDAAFKQVLTLQITGALLAQGLPQATAQAQAAALASTPAVFTNPLLASVLSPTNVKGLVVYHLLGFRDFSVNFPTTATAYPTLLNTAIAAHPGVRLQATFGATGVTAATVKGVVNPTASNVVINPTPFTGTSDQHYVNGVIHFIDQVLLPQ